MKPLLEIAHFTTKIKIFSDKIVIKKTLSEKEILIKDIKNITRKGKKSILCKTETNDFIVKLLDRKNTDATFNFLNKKISEDEYKDLLKSILLKNRKRNIAILFAIISFVLVLMYFANAFDFQKRDKAQEVVLKYLKSPTSAIFCEDYSYSDFYKDTHIIESCVNSQNGFGAIIKTNWVVKLGKSLKVINVNIGGVTYVGEKTYEEKMKHR